MSLIIKEYLNYQNINRNNNNNNSFKNMFKGFVVSMP